MEFYFLNDDPLAYYYLGNLVDGSIKMGLTKDTAIKYACKSAQVSFSINFLFNIIESATPTLLESEIRSASSTTEITQQHHQEQ